MDFIGLKNLMDFIGLIYRILFGFIFDLLEFGANLRFYLDLFSISLNFVEIDWTFQFIFNLLVFSFQLNSILTRIRFYSYFFS